MKDYRYHENRNAVIRQNHKGYVVDLYEDNMFVRTVDVSDHNVRYAEEVVENWVMGIINE